MARASKRMLSKLLVAGLALAFLPGAKNGCGSKEANETLTSPVQAVTTLLERNDGSVEAELVLISTSTSKHQFVDTAKNAQVRMPDGTAVPLSLSSPGHYGADSASNSSLVYDPGATYQFKFELDDAAAAKKVAGGSFVAVMTAPDDVVTFSFTKPPAFAGDTADLQWSPTNRYALIEVRDAAGDLVYANFDFTQPTFDGSKWARLKKGGSDTLGVDVFADPGSYTVSLCAVDKVSDFDKSLSSELGALSGFLIGRCAADVAIDVSP